MPQAPRPLWAGRTLALAAIVLLALNLRTAVTALSPIVAFITEDVPLDPLLLGVLGMLAPIAFAAGGILAPALTRRFGLESTLVGACAILVAGPLLRAAATSPAVLLFGTALLLLGVGVGNVLLPPAVKRYFPDRIGLLTSIYATLLSLSTALPPAVAVPVAEGAGWRTAIGVWAVVGLCALVPWAMLWLRGRRTAKAPLLPAAANSVLLKPDADLGRRVRASPIAWAMVLAMGVNSLNSYAMFAWLPQLLIEQADATPASGAFGLVVYAIVGMALSVVAPVLTVRLKSVAPLLVLAALSFTVAYSGLLLWPRAAPMLWVTFASIGTILFPVVLVLINSRTRTPAGSVALSGFTQGLGYTVAAIGPLGVGLLRDVSGGWTAPLVFLLICGLVALVPAAVLRRPGYADDPRG